MNPRVLAVVVFLAGCSSMPAPAPLEAIPHPEIVELEDQVRTQLGASRRALEEALAGESEDAGLADLFGATGMLYHAYNLRSAAAACYRNAALLAPDEFRWAYYSARLSLDAGDLEYARAELERAIEIRPDEVPALIRLARLELESNRLAWARQWFERALVIDASNPTALSGLGKVAFSDGDFQTAVQHFEAARALAPQASKIHYPLGLAYRGLGRRELAKRFVAQRGDVPPPLADPWMQEIGALVGGMRVHQMRGTSYFDDGLYEKALAEFRLAIAQAPDDPGLRTNLAVTLIKFNDPEGALREFAQALRLNPDDAFAHYNLGTLLASLGRNDEAVEHLRVAIELEPGQLRAHLNLANALVRLERPKAALPHYRIVAEGDPGNLDVFTLEARTLARVGRWVDARRRLEEAHAAAPENVSIRHDLVRLLAAAPDGKARDGRRARTLAQALMTPPIPIAHGETLAMIAAENGLFDHAAELQRRLVESARSAGRTKRLNVMLGNLELYRSGQACRTPWPALEKERTDSAL